MKCAGWYIDKELMKWKEWEIKMKDENILAIIALIAFLLFLAFFVSSYVDLERFKTCYDINFQSNRCERYLNYWN